jgi:hypothetical protein
MASGNHQLHDEDSVPVQNQQGILNSYDNAGVNAFIEPAKRPIPFDRMVYFGDGDTDIPSMRLVKEQGGCSLAVFDQ